MSRRPLPIAVKLTYTPLDGGASTVIEEAFERPARRIRRCAVHMTQSVGNQTAEVEVDNRGNAYDWVSGSRLRIEAKLPQDAAYSLLLDGFVAEPEVTAGHLPVLRVPVVGPNAVLDMVNLASDATFAAGTAWTSIFDSLCSANLSGYTRVITSDAAAPTDAVTFPAGMRLREALDLVRRALIAATTQKWEALVVLDGASKQVKLYKRGSASQATVRFADLLRGAKRSKGSAFDLVNRARVYGATVSKKVQDKTGLTKAGTVRLDATTDLAAQPFVADASPLYAHRLYMDRSSGKDPPGLAGVVARNSDNWDRVGYAAQKRPVGGATILRNRAPSGGTVIASIDDHNTTTQVQWSMTAAEGEAELVVWDFGAGGMSLQAWLLVMGGSFAATDHVRLYGSNDDSSYTSLDDVASPSSGTGWRSLSGAPVGPYRYVKVTGQVGSDKTFTFAEVWLGEFDNLSTDATNPKNCMRDEDGGGVTTVATTGAQTKELYRADLRSSRAVAKLVARHSESSASSLLTLVWQKSSDGSSWSDIQVLDSTTSTVIDTSYLDEGDFRYIRLVAKDDRSGGSASITSSLDYCQAFLQVSSWHRPLTGDSMRGGSWTWTVANLVQHPALVEPQTYPAPRLVLVVGRLYWFVYTPQSGAAAPSYWELDYATDASTPAAALASTDGGSTWSNVATNAVLKHKTEFDNSQLAGEADDTASQTKYANFVPGGVLHGAIVDQSLRTQDLVSRAASALVTARGDVKDLLHIPIAFNPAVAVGSPVTIDQDCLYYLGTSGDFDVLEHHMDITAHPPTSTLVLNDHPARSADAATLVSALASGGSV